MTCERPARDDRKARDNSLACSGPSLAQPEDVERMIWLQQNGFMFTNPPSPDHQPLCLLQDDDTWRAGCACGWLGHETYEHRAEAHALAYAHDRQVAA